MPSGKELIAASVHRLHCAAYTVEVVPAGSWNFFFFFPVLGLSALAGVASELHVAMVTAAVTALSSYIGWLSPVCSAETVIIR